MLLYHELPEEIISYIDEWKGKKGCLIMILRKIQNHYDYVPEDICFLLADELKLPLARIYEVLTFYNYFKLQESAKYKIAVCSGTACYLKGAPELIEIITKKLVLNNDFKSQDGLFKLENVRCMGCCGLAPVININGKIYGKLNADKLTGILDKYIEKG